MLAASLLAALPLAAEADEMSYSYVDLAYAGAHLEEPVGRDGEGFAVRGSVGFAENFFAFGEYVSIDFELGTAHIDADLYNIGLGGHLGIADNVDLVGRAAYAHVKTDSPDDQQQTDSGYLVSAGIRGRVAEGFELEGNLMYTDFGGPGGGDAALAVSGRYFFTPNFAINGEYVASDDLRQWFAGVRFAF